MDEACVYISQHDHKIDYNITLRSPPLKDHTTCTTFLKSQLIHTCRTLWTIDYTELHSIIGDKRMFNIRIEDS